MKKLIKIFTACLLMLAMLCPASLAAAPADETKLDVAIVIDSSGSMKQTDKNRLAIEAAKLFVDMMGINGSRVGVVSFSDNATRLVEVVDVSSAAAKTKVKSAIDSLSYSGGTDIGLALKTGIDMLHSAGDKGNKTTVLFFTDGRIDTSGKTGRTNEQSRQDALDAIASVTGVFPIYSIGLNADGTVDTGLIKKMADSTGGRSYIVESSDELPGIFNEIFADFIKSNIMNLGSFVTDGVNYTRVPVKIPNDSILEANIIMLLSGELMDVNVTNPAGTGLPVDGKKVILSKSRMYYMLKLVNPEKGDWMLNIKGPKDCKVHVNLVYNYNLVLKSDLQSNPDGTYQVKSHFETQGSAITDNSFYTGFKATATVTSPDGTATEHPMTVQGNYFDVQLKPDKPGDYTVSVRADSESVYRISEPLTFNIKENSAPVIGPGIPDRVDLKGLFLFSLSEKLKVAGNITDPDGDAVTCSIKGPDADVASVTDDKAKGILTVKARGNGSSSFVLEASDGKGGVVSKTIQVSVQATFKTILPIILIIVGLAAVIAAALFLLKKYKEKNAIFYGCVKYIISVNGEMSSGREQRFELGYNRGSVKLNYVINSLETAEMDLDKIVLYPDTKTNSGIRIVNRSQCEMAVGYGGSGVPEATLGDGESVMITKNGSSGSLTVRLSYSVRDF